MRTQHYDTPTPWLVGDRTPDTPRVGDDIPLPVVAELVCPAHLPAVWHVQPEVEQLTERGVPVRIVSAVELGGCEDCADDPSLGHLDAVAVVRATSATGRAHEVKVCPLHLSRVVTWFARQGMPLVVQVPAMGGRRWFERDTRETWFAIDDSVGVVVSRDVSDTWTVYLHEENRAPVILAARVGLSGPGAARERAEWLGQAVASQYARDAALAADNDTPAVAA